MHRLRRLILVAVCVSLMGAAMPAGDLPPNTVLLSTMMQQLSARPGFTEAFLAQVEGSLHGKRGAALLTPALVHHLRDIILGKDWQRLDDFPGWTMTEINRTVRIAAPLAARNPKIDSTATAGGRPVESESLLDLGEYDSASSVDLSQPATGKGFDEKDLVTTLGEGVTRGDGPNELAPLHAESQRLADVLNRLSMNERSPNPNPDQSPAGAPPNFAAHLDGHAAYTPEGLIDVYAASGYRVELADVRYFANFGHLHFQGRDVMMPFRVNTQIVVPGTRRPLLVPVAHAEYEWRIYSPASQLVAAVSFYFGIDGKAEFRTLDQLDQAWVMKRQAHVYSGPDLREATRLCGAMVRAYDRLHKANPHLPFGGYYTLGVCQDVVAAIELKLTGRVTLFPNTADERFFTGPGQDPRDAEIDALIARLPRDSEGRPPDVARVFGSLPVGSSELELRTISIPGLADDLIAVHRAWSQNDLHRTGPHWRRWALIAAGALLLAGLLTWLRRRV